MKRACMVVYAYYPRDSRVRKEAEALAGRGYGIDVVCLRQGGERREETVGGVNVFRLPMRTAREGGKLRYAYQYAMFFLIASFAVSVLNIRRKYCIIHAHSLPDFLVFTGALPRRAGAKLILDMHEAMPEVYLSRLHASGKNGLYRLFVLIERASAKFADRVITVSDIVKGIFVKRGINEEKITVICNVPAIERMAEPRRREGRKIVFSGNMNEYHDFDTVLSSVKKLADVELHIYGDGVLYQPVSRKIRELGIEGRVTLHGWVPQEELKEALPLYSAGIIPFSDLPITRIILANKAFEYTASGTPVVSVDLPGLRTIFDDSCFYYYGVGDVDGLCRALGDALSDADGSARKVRSAQKVIIQNKLTWSDLEERLSALYDGLCKPDKP